MVYILAEQSYIILPQTNLKQRINIINIIIYKHIYMMVLINFYNNRVSLIIWVDLLRQTIGLAHSTNSSIRTGHAPSWS